MIAFNCFEIARWMLRRLETEAEVVNVNELFGMIALSDSSRTLLQKRM